MSGSADELVQVSELVALAAAHGFAVAGLHESTPAEFNAFETGFTAGYVRWLVDHEPDHPEAAAVHKRLAAQQAAYFDGYRVYMSLAYPQLIAV